MLDSKANRIILGSVADEYFEPYENNDFLDSAEAEEWDDIIDDGIEHSIENSDVISPQFLTGLHRLKASSIGNFFKNARVGLKSTVILAKPSDASKMQRNAEKRLIDQLLFHLHTCQLRISSCESSHKLRWCHEASLQEHRTWGGASKRRCEERYSRPHSKAWQGGNVHSLSGHDVHWRDFLDWGACLRNHPLVPESGSCLRHRKEHCDGLREASYDKKSSFFKHLPRCLGRQGRRCHPTLQLHGNRSPPPPSHRCSFEGLPQGID